jgi:hypothetical protein
MNSKAIALYEAMREDRDRLAARVAEQRDVLENLRGYILACVGDAEGKLAVERGRMLTLTAGQIAVLAEALELIDAALAESPDRGEE